MPVSIRGTHISQAILPYAIGADPQSGSSPGRPRRRSVLRIVLIAILLASTGCSDLGRPLLPKAQAVLSVSSLDFGTVAVSESSLRDVVVTNTGTGPLSGEAVVGCPEYIIESGGGPFVVPPGGSRTVRVRFQPNGVGAFPCTLDLGVHTGSVTLSGAGALQAPGAQSFAFPDTLDFGVVAKGESSTLSLKLFSIGSAPLIVDVVSACGDFIITSGGGPGTVAPGGSLTITLQFAPSTGQGHACSLSLGPGIPEVFLSGFATTVSFGRDVVPIFQMYCESCHIFSDPSAGYSVLTVQPISYAPGVRVIPYDLSRSVLYGKITNSGQYGALMPQGGPLIPLADRNTIRDWILEGARNN